MTDAHFPVDIQQLTPAILSATIRKVHPHVAVQTMAIVESKAYGEEMVSTAARAVLDLTYSGTGSQNLPGRVILKLARDNSKLLAPFYENEVNFYNRLRPELDMEAPVTLGGDYDAQTGQFGLLLEDLTQRQAHFPNVTEAISLAQVESLLDQLAILHARYWESPRFE